MKLVPIAPQFLDKAWKEGASCLAKACDTSGGEIEGPQLKMILARGERTLIRMESIPEKGDLSGCAAKTVGWGVVRIDQMPNMRVLFVTDLVAPHGHFERFFTALREMAAAQGCSRIRCAAKPAQARLYRAKVGFRPVYEILESEV